MADVRRYEIKEFGDVVDPGTAVRDGATVEVSVRAVAPDLARRVLDFFSGVAFTGDGAMTRVSRGIFRIVPAGVGSSGSATTAPPPDPTPTATGLLSLPRPRPRSEATGLGQIGPLYGKRP